MTTIEFSIPVTDIISANGREHHMKVAGKAKRLRTEHVVRCGVCHAPRCGDSGDNDPCMERRHHDGLHIYLSGEFAPLSGIFAPTRLRGARMTTWCPCGEWKCDDGANLCPCCCDNAAAIRRHISEAIDRVQRASATVEARARQMRLGPNLQISQQGET